jgi:hypothetical protein
MVDVPISNTPPPMLIHRVSKICEVPHLQPSFSYMMGKPLSCTHVAHVSNSRPSLRSMFMVEYMPIATMTHLPSQLGRWAIFYFFDTHVHEPC